MQSKRQITLVRSTCFKRPSKKIPYRSTTSLDKVSKMSSDTFGRVESKVGSSEQCAIDGDLPINRYQEDSECRKEKNILSPLHTGSSVFSSHVFSYETTQFCFKENRNCVSVKKRYKYEMSGRSQMQCFQKTKLCILSVIKIIIMRNLSKPRLFPQMFSQ